MFKNSYTFVRHGEYERYTNEEGKLVSRLTQKGSIQALALGDKLADAGIDVVVSSPNARALESARIIGKRLALEPVVSRFFAERDEGELKGIPRPEQIERWPDLFDGNGRFRVNAQIPGGEGLADFCIRVLQGLVELEDVYQENDILVVTHTNVIWAIICHGEGKDFSEVARTHPIDFCDMVTI